MWIRLIIVQWALSHFYSNFILNVYAAENCQDEAADNRIDVLFSKDGDILLLDEWNEMESDELFRSVMADQATLYCVDHSHECSVLEYNQSTHSFEEENVIIASTKFSNGYIQVSFYITLTGIETVFAGSETTFVLRRDTLKSITIESVGELNAALNFTTAFVDGELVTDPIDNSLDKIIIPIAFGVVLMLFIIMWILIRNHDEVEEMKRKSGYGSRTRVSPAIELTKVEKFPKTQFSEDIEHRQMCSNSDINSMDLNPELKYNHTDYGNHGHVPRIGLPHGPTPYAYPRRSFKSKECEEERSAAANIEMSPPCYEEVYMPPKEPPIEEKVIGDRVVEEPANDISDGKKISADEQPIPALIQRPLVDPAKRLPPLVLINTNSTRKEESITTQEMNNTSNKINGVNGGVKQNSPVDIPAKKDKPKITFMAEPAKEKITEDITKDSKEQNRVSELQENAMNSIDETRKSPRKKHKKHKHKHKHHRHDSDEENLQNEQERSGEEEEQQKRKKHRKKKKKHRRKYSDDEDLVDKS